MAVFTCIAQKKGGQDLCLDPLSFRWCGVIKFCLGKAPPTPPTKPNTVVGQVMDPDGKIVEGAILEIKDPRGRPARALKTNMLGHFMIVTPLLDGRYEILAEKEGLVFEPVTFSAKGAIIPPLSIWAKTKENVN